MAVKKLKRGDLVAMKVPGYNTTYKCAVVETMRGGQSGRLLMLVKDDFSSLYFEPSDLKNMRRLKVSQVPKKLADHTKKWRK